MSPDRRGNDLVTEAITGSIVPTLKLVSRYGLSTVCFVGLLGWLLFRFEGKLDANNAMLAEHVRVTEIGAYQQYLSCLQLTKISGDLPQACDVPKLRKE